MSQKRHNTPKMIIKVKKRDLLVLMGVLVLIIFIPLIYSQTPDNTPQTRGLGVWVVIANIAPTNISIWNATFSATPSASSTKQIVIVFNASDENGAGQLNGTSGGKVVVNLTLGTPDVAQFRTQDRCDNYTADPGKVVFNCSVLLKYYDNASNAWVVNITVTDSNSATAKNDTIVFTYNNLAGFSLNARGVSEEANLNFSSANIGVNDQAAKAPILLNNTGNADFDQINITGADLTSNGNTIVIGQFAVNVTNNTVGAGLVLTTGPQTIPATEPMGDSGGSNPNATLMHGPGISGDSDPYPGVANFKTKGNQTLLFWVDIPAGTATGTYNNTWNITVIDKP